MATTRRKPKSGKKSYEIGWHANPKLGAYWYDHNNNGHTETAIFSLMHDLASLQVEIEVWDADWYGDPDNYGKGLNGTIRIEVITDSAAKLDEFLLVITNSELYKWLRLPPHRWDADDIFAGADSDRIHRHLNVDVNDETHPCWETAMKLMNWLILVFRGQKTLFDHCYY